MPASTRLLQLLRPLLRSLLRPLLLALALAAPAAGALAHPLYAAAAPDGAASHAPAIDIDLGNAAGADVIGAEPIGVPGRWDAEAVEAVKVIDDSARLPGTACRFNGGCYAVRLDPLSPVPEPGALAMLGFGLALVVLRGQRPANTPFRAD